MQAQNVAQEENQPRQIEVKEKTFSILNPATGEKVGEYPHMGPEEVERAVQEARKAFSSWSQTPFSLRRKILLKAASHLAENARYYANIIASETGKTRLDAILAEVFPTCDLLHYYGKHAERFLKPVKASGVKVLPGRKAYYTFEPRGVVGIISPWNYPFSLAAGPVVSALASGNTVVFKPSSQTTASGRIMKEIFTKAGLPDEVLQVITGSGSVTGKALIENRDLDMLFFTGSTGVGLEVNQAAAKNLIPAVMELGGKDSMIITRNADLERAAHAAVWGSFFNSGQTCIGVEFCFVERSVYEPFLEKVTEITKKIEHGTMDGQMGSMTMKSQLMIVEEQIKDATAKGAKVLVGGERGKNPNGLFFAPTVITGIHPDMKIWQEETFGPILPVIPFDTQEEAIEMANSTPFGLSGSVFSENVEEARWYATRMVTGSVNINDCLVTFAFPSLPFGGAKESGVGYYHSELGIRNFCRIKSITEFSGLYTKEFFHYPVPKGVREGMEALLVFLYSQNQRAKWQAFFRTSGIARELIAGVLDKQRKGRGKKGS